MLSPASQVFIDRLPHRPYCSDDLDHGLKIRPAKTALQHRHIQPNAPLEVSWLVFDVDYQGAAIAWESAGLPPPTITAINPANAHAHLFYGLATPIVMSDAGRDAPIRYAAALQTAFRARLRADPGYAGLIAKNPVSEAWRTIWVQHLYDLGELAEYVDLPKARPPRDVAGLGRNCTLFDELRAWAYQCIREYKRNGATPTRWHAEVLGQAERINATSFDTPLSFGEVQATAKSVGKWTWKKFSNESFAALQSARGRRGGRPKTTTADGEPWLELGISRSTYYRRAGSAVLIPS